MLTRMQGKADHSFKLIEST